MELSLAPDPPRRRSSASSSPEFEFWICPQPDLVTADELFVDGVLLPLHLLALNPDPEPDPEPEPPTELPPASICSTASPPSSSRRWKDIFKVGDKKPEDKDKRKPLKTPTPASTELNININIWPFSRSRSAGTGRPRPAAAARKSSSAPCSRSNSRGESTKPPTGPTRKWAPSPGRVSLSGGVHLGRTSPVWQIRRPARAGETGSGRRGNGGGGRVLSLNMNTCIGYRHQVRCRGEDNDGMTVGDGAGDRAGGNGGLFNLRSLFSKKVY